MKKNKDKKLIPTLKTGLVLHISIVSEWIFLILSLQDFLYWDKQNANTCSETQFFWNISIINGFV